MLVVCCVFSTLFSQEWEPVVKEEMPVTCSDEIKKSKAVTSLEILDARRNGQVGIGLVSSVSSLSVP